MSDFQRKTFSKHQPNQQFGANFISGIIRSLIYFAAAYVFYSSLILKQKLGSTAHLLLCVAILSYAIFRAYRAFTEYRRNENDKIKD